MPLPPNIATPTVVTGKTTQSPVVDVYAENPTIQDNVAQNTIKSVLTGSASSLFGELTKGVNNLLKSESFNTDLGTLIGKAINGEINTQMVKDTLNGYKDGLLNGLMSSVGVSSLSELKENVIQAAGDTLFGNVQGIVNNFAPGLLDSQGIKSFDDMKKTYNKIADEVKSLKDLNSDNALAFLSDGSMVTSRLANDVLATSVNIVGGVLETGKNLVSQVNRKLDTAILKTATLPLIGENNSATNDFILDAFKDKPDELNDYLTSAMSDIAKVGAYDFINKSAEILSKENISWMMNSSTSSTTTEFVSSISIGGAKPLTSEDIKKKEEEIIKSIEIVSGAMEGQLKISDFQNISDEAKNILKYGDLGPAVVIGQTMTPSIPFDGDMGQMLKEYMV